MRSALFLSLWVTLASTLIVAVIGTISGYLISRRRFPGRGLLEAVLNLPLVLPPTVTGYYLIVLLGRRGLLGETLFEWTGFTVPFTWVACVVAASLMAFPLMLRSALVAFESIDPRQALAAASLGHGRLSTFFRVLVPMARRGLLAGMVLSFARALGEFGATLMLAGNIPGRTQTLPLAIYEAALSGEDRDALLMAGALTLVSVIVMILAGRLDRKTA
ncbi:MAG: molybdate ABC transporter permease subunit [Acidobacteria bacterium]|uniref:Molybdenum transport system permease n=1 Tax=Candidatus Polarisedimenticola svalbardensis TaxID=2886004 RepID=A0A8J6XYD1_9BACT|nr:molybdate ABC transporter permease subunit [Candidatus Polarisedimenticola svalbardensis]